MRLRLVLLTAVVVLVGAGPALAQSNAGGTSSSSAGGSTASSGNSSSTASVRTSGPASVGVVQGAVSEGSGGGSSTGASSGSGGGSRSAGSSGGGAGAGGQAAGVAEGPSPVTGGVLSDLQLPAMDVARDTVTASRTAPDLAAWAVGAAIVLGLAVLYRRLPRPVAQ